MCQLSITVAQVRDFEYIAYCEHGTIHLGWQCAVFHLHPPDFRRLAQLLQQSAVATDFSQLWGNEGHCCLVRQQNGCFQLWLGSAVLFLTVADLLRLGQLVHAATPPLSQVFPDNAEALKSTPFYYGKVNSPPSGDMFGVN